MDHQAAAAAYRQGAVENAPPIKIVRMLYQGAIRFIDQALQADETDPTSPFIERVHAVDQIVCELRLSLDAGHAPEVCQNLERLYLFVEDRIMQASLERSKEPLGDARAVLETLLAAWSHVEVETTRVA